MHMCECVCKLVRCVSAYLFGAILNSESGVSVQQSVLSEQTLSPGPADSSRSPGGLRSLLRSQAVGKLGKLTGQARGGETEGTGWGESLGGWRGGATLRDI